MIFLKLGGSLITDKSGHEVARTDHIHRLAGEIADAYRASPGMKLLIGHGSGSFGHRAADQFGTHGGAESPDDWRGFSEVAAAAQRLHRIVLDALRDAGLAVLSFPPSSMLTTEAGKIVSYAFSPITSCLHHNLIPIVYGDVAFDTTLGSSIVSTEQVMTHLVPHLRPQRMLLAGKIPGIQTDDSSYLSELKARDVEGLRFYAPEGADVTGGMKTKVEEALSLAERFPELEVLIFGAEQPGNLFQVLMGGSAGTRVLAG